MEVGFIVLYIFIIGHLWWPTQAEACVTCGALNLVYVDENLLPRENVHRIWG